MANINDPRDIYLSVIVPVYNSRSFLANSLADLDAFISGFKYPCELVVVDDGSTDKSIEILNDFATSSRSYGVKIVQHEKNKGKGAAVATGMIAAAGKYRVFLDADLAYPPAQILKILAALEGGNDVAVANRICADSRYTISPAFFHYLYTRHVASRILNWLLKLTLIPHCGDSQAGLKGFKAPAAQEIFSRQKIFGFPFDVEALFLAERMGLRIREVPVDYRYFNEPTTVVFMQDGMGMAKDILKIRFNFMMGKYEMPTLGTRKKVVVNADDYAMNIEVSRGILKAAEGGILKSTSAITNSPDFDQSMDELARRGSNLDVGFHANLTWGKPLLDPSKIKTIVDESGNFLSRNKLIKKALFGKLSGDEVYLEIREQCQKLKNKIGRISHMDCHHHVHILPIVRDAAKRVASEFDIPFMRSPREGQWSPWQWSSLSRLFVSALASSRPAYWRCRGFFSAEWFGGFALGSGPRAKKRWLETLKRIPAGTAEIMVHPGYASECSDEYNQEREDEIALLLDKSLKSAAQNFGVEFVSFNDLLGEKA